MNIAIQLHKVFNLLPITQYLQSALDDIHVVLFNETVDPVGMLREFKPDIIIYHSDSVSQSVFDLINNSKMALIEHSVDNQSHGKNVQFSLVKADHPNYFPPRCNTRIMKGASYEACFEADISCVGPFSPRLAGLIAELLPENGLSVRFYGENHYKNWRYCGALSEPQIKNVYKSSQTTLCYNSGLEYDFRVLDCIVAGGVPICERNEALITRFGDVMDTVSFKQGGILDTHNRIEENRLDILSELRKVRLDVMNGYTWSDLIGRVFSEIGLKTAAKKILADKDRP